MPGRQRWCRWVAHRGGVVARDVGHDGSAPHCHCMNRHLAARHPPSGQQADAAFLRSSGALPALLACLRWVSAEPFVARHAESMRPSQLALQHRLLAFLCAAARQGGGAGAALREAGVEEVVEAVRRGATLILWAVRPY